MTSIELKAIEPGSSLGRYRLVERLGEGGMGEVWKAHDANLDRTVAVKVIRRSATWDDTIRERFRREALALSRLSHSGVATVFDFDAQDGYDYLVMEYVAGGTLASRLSAGPLQIDEVLRLAAAIAEGLENAHRNGVLHRDLKPGNIVLTNDGNPKILDFGLAVLLSEDAVAGRITEPGLIVGSLPYMAPEQLYGEADDVRSDIYALGAVLFEMVSGERPFEKDRAGALMFAIINNAPPPLRSLRPDVPEDLERLVAACLEKERANRPQTAAVVAESLRRIYNGVSSGALTFTPTSGVRSIAVLPFRNVSNDSSQEYFADGMTETLISDLAQIKALRVISRTSAMKYKQTQLSVPEVARELNVDAVLEGSALLIGNRVRLNVQLISARADSTLWADRYDRELEDVLGLQSELAQTIAREISIQITPAEEIQLARYAPVNPQAHLEFLKSRHSVYVAAPEALRIGLIHARRAIEIDPTFPLAWTALADCLIFRVIRGVVPASEAVPEAAAAARKALELDPILPDAHASMGLILSHTGDVSGGRRALQKAVDLNPGLAGAHNLLGRTLYALGRHTEAQASMHKSMSLDPLSMVMYAGAGDAYYFARDYEKSILHYRMALVLDSGFDGAHTGLARSLEALGRFEEARSEYEEGRRLSGGLAGPSFGLAHLAVAMGNRDEALRILSDLESARSSRVVSAWGIAVLHAHLGNIDEAFKWLYTAIDEHASGVIVLRVHPRLEPIRNDPRYDPLVRRLGLNDASSVHNG
ncbi:MAG TPA: protein kinase [Gemmatimonadaceae bacterium]|nr:protein kinase [Gemmatimonadaceae bacterium]